MPLPAVVLLVLGSAVLLLFQWAGRDPLGALSVVWPEKGAALTVQYVTSDLRMQAEHQAGKQKLARAPEAMVKDCQRLEKLGMATAIVQRGQVLYVTEGQDAHLLRDQIARHMGHSRSAEVWDERGFFFVYQSRHGLEVLAKGGLDTMPEERPQRMGPPPDLVPPIIGIVLLLTAAAVIVLGRLLARMASRQILGPLAELSRAADAIRKGDLSQPVSIPSHDEVGEVCEDFEQMRRELLRAREEEQRYTENRKELLAGISHDLRTPLTALSGYVSGLQDGIARTPEKRNHYLTQMQAGIWTLTHMVEDLFLFSKLDLGKEELHREPVHLKRYLEDFASERSAVPAEGNMEAGEESAHREIRVEGSPACDLAALDRRQFARVVENLLSNSRKYSRDGQAQIEIQLSEHRGQPREDSAADGETGCRSAGRTMGAAWSPSSSVSSLRASTARMPRGPAWRRAAASDSPLCRRSSRRTEAISTRRMSRAADWPSSWTCRS